MVRSEVVGKDRVLTFDGVAAGMAPADHVGKLLGSTRQGELLFGYARLPGVSFTDPIVNAPPPSFTRKGIRLRVENFGLQASKPGKVVVAIAGADGSKRTTEAVVSSIAPYAGADVVVPVDCGASRGGKMATADIQINCGGSPINLTVPVSILSPDSNGNTRLSLKTACSDRCGWGQSKQDRDISGRELSIGTRQFSPTQ